MRFDDIRRVERFVEEATELSIYHAPEDFGLSLLELKELAKGFDIAPGELQDHYMGGATIESRGTSRLKPSAHLLNDFNFRREPDYRDKEAFQFVHDEMVKLARQHGRTAKLPRNTLIERAASAGLDRSATLVAVAILLHCGEIKESDDGLCGGSSGYAAPNAQNEGRLLHSHFDRKRLHAAVGDVVARRKDGRPQSADPLKAFSEDLEMLGYSNFRQWWMLTVTELEQLSPLQSPTAVTVLSAAVVEGALTFVVKRARELNLGPMGSKTFEGNARTWKIDDLVKSAVQGGKDAILDEPTKDRALNLIDTRQRIHAGRMLDMLPKAPPDLRPEHATDGLETAKRVVRSVSDWLAKHSSK